MICLFVSIYTAQNGRNKRKQVFAIVSLFKEFQKRDGRRQPILNLQKLNTNLHFIRKWTVANKVN